MRILIIGFSYSIHVVRWINRLQDTGWDVHVFPSQDLGTVHSALTNVTVYHSVYHKNTRAVDFNNQVRQRGFALSTPVLRRNRRIQNILSVTAHATRYMIQMQFSSYRARQLARLIDKLQPDIIHSMEFQAAGYLMVRMKGYFRGPLPPLLVTNFGSDIYLFGRLAGHEQQVKEVLRIADYYTCECQRDVEIVVRMGFDREKTSVIPIGGSFDLEHCARFRQPGPASKRKLIFIKGYQGWAGRSLVALHALRLCRDALQGYEIAIHLPSGMDVAIAAELVSQDIGIPIQLVPHSPHDRMLELMGRARVHIGLSISDAASTSMLESLVMGAFPIQSCTACADEYFVDGESGLLVPPEDPHAVAEALRRALTDDALVDRAAEMNAKVAAERLEFSVVRDQTVALYQRIYDETRPGSAFVSKRKDTWSRRANEDTRPLPALTQTPLVSVITPLGNDSDYLAEVIDSVLAQQYPAVEHIILYSRQSPDIDELQAKYGQRVRWGYVPSFETGTLLEAALHLMRGKYLLWVAADEPVLPRLTATAVAYMQRHPDCALLYTDSYQIDQESVVRAVHQKPDYTYDDLLRLGADFSLTGMMVRPESVQPIATLPEYGPLNSLSLVLALQPDITVCHLDELLATRRHSVSRKRTATREFRSAIEKARLTKRLLRRNAQHPNLARYAQDTLSAAYYEAAQAATHSVVSRTKYAIKAWTARPRLWDSGSKRHPTIYSVALLLSPGFIRPLLKLLKYPLGRLHPRGRQPQQRVPQEGRQI